MERSAADNGAVAARVEPISSGAVATKRQVLGLLLLGFASLPVMLILITNLIFNICSASPPVILILIANLIVNICLGYFDPVHVIFNRN